MAETEVKHTSLSDSQGVQGAVAPHAVLSGAAILRHLRTPLYRNAYYLMANTIALSLSGFVFWTVAARLYQPAEVGLGSALISATTLLASISNLGLGMGLIRFLPTARDAWRLIASCLVATAVLAVLSSVVFLGGAGVWSPKLAFVSQQPFLLITFVTFAVGGTLSALVNFILIAQRRAQYTFVKGLIIGFGRIPLLAGLAFLSGAYAIFAAPCVISLAVVGAAVWWVRHGTKPASPPRERPAGQELGHLMGFSLSNYVAGLIYGAPSMLLPLLVLNVLGAEANGYFYVSWMVAGLLGVVPMAMSQSLFAEGSHFEPDVRGNAMKALKLSVGLVLPGVLAVFLFADKVLAVFGRDYVEGGAMLLRILALAAIPIIINSVYFTIKRVEKRMVAVVCLSAVIAAGTLGLSYFLMPRVGLLGIGIGWLGSQSGCAIVVGAAAVFRLRARAPRDRGAEGEEDDH